MSIDGAKALALYPDSFAISQYILDSFRISNLNFIGSICVLIYLAIMLCTFAQNDSNAFNAASRSQKACCHDPSFKNLGENAGIQERNNGADTPTARRICSSSWWRWIPYGKYVSRFWKLMPIILSSRQLDQWGKDGHNHVRSGFSLRDTSWFLLQQVYQHADTWRCPSLPL